MASAAAHLRTMLTRYLDARADVRLAAMGGDLRAASREGLEAQHFLLSESAGEVFSEARAEGEISQTAAEALLRHLVAVHAGAILARPRHEAWSSLLAPEAATASMARIIGNTDHATRSDQARDWAARVGPAARRIAQAHEEAAELSMERGSWLAGLIDDDDSDPVTDPGQPDVVHGTGSAQPPEESATDAADSAPAHLLAATDDAAEELFAWLCRGQPERTWHGLLVAMRGREIGVPGPLRERFRRVATGLRGLGYEADMGRGLRAVVDLREQGPWTTTVSAPGLPHVHVAQGPLEYGIWSEMAASEGVAAGLCRVLASSALEVEQMPSAAIGLPGAAPAMGGLWMQLWADPVYLKAVHGLSGRELEVTSRHAAVVLLAVVRASAALACQVRSPEGRDFDERSEGRAQALSRALCCPVPVAVAQHWWSGPRVAVSVAEGRLSGLSLHAALRDALDQDWFRNPRVDERLRGAAARGADLDGWAWCDEQGGQATGAAARLLELVP